MKNVRGKVVALVCARAGSKGLLGKNLRKLSGKPLISYSILSGMRCKKIASIIVSTDCQKIAKVATDLGAEVPFLRPESLASDTASEWDVWRHALNYLSDMDSTPSALVVLPPTAPLRADCDITNAIDLFFANQCDGVICGAPASRNPEFNMVKLDHDGFCHLAIPSKKNIYRRQDSAEYFDINTVCYVMNPESVMREPSLLAGKILLNTVPVERAVDIDTQLDFSWAEFLLSKRNSNA